MTDIVYSRVIVADARRNSLLRVCILGTYAYERARAPWHYENSMPMLICYVHEMSTASMGAAAGMLVDGTFLLCVLSLCVAQGTWPYCPRSGRTV